LSGTTSPRKLTFDGKSGSPIWADNRYVIFSSLQETGAVLFRQLADGTAPADRLTNPEPFTFQFAESVSPSGKELVFGAFRGDQTRLWILPLDGDRKATPLLESPPNSVQTHASFSPDGHWVAYSSTDRTSTQAWVQPYPG